MGALKSKMWDDYVELRVRETQRRELASAVIHDFFGPTPPERDADEIEGVFVIDHLEEDGLVLGRNDTDDFVLARVQVPTFLRRLLRYNDSYFFRLVKSGDGFLTSWMGSPWLQ